MQLGKKTEGKKTEEAVAKSQNANGGRKGGCLCFGSKQDVYVGDSSAQ